MNRFLFLIVLSLCAILFFLRDPQPLKKPIAEPQVSTSASPLAAHQEAPRAPASLRPPLPIKSGELKGGPDFEPQAIGLISRYPFRLKKLLFAEDSQEPGGIVVHRRMVETSFHYPKIQIEEKIIHDASSQQDVVISRQSWVADHILVKLAAGHTEEELLGAISSLGAQIRKIMSPESLYLVEFDPKDLGQMRRLIQQLSQSRVVQYAEPDPIASAR